MKFCPKCAMDFPDDHTYCPKCSSPLVDKATGAALPLPSPFGSIGARTLAHLLDIILFLVPAYFLVGNGYGALFGGLTESGFDLHGVPALIAIGVTVLAFGFYLLLFEGLVGATPGKFLLGLRVNRVAGGPPSFAQALVRNLLRIVDAFAVYLLGLIVALISKKRQRVGDLAAQTIVVKEAHGAGKRAAAGFFLALWVAAAVFGSIFVRRHTRVPPTTFAIASLRFADSETAPPRLNAEYKPLEEVRLYYEVPGYQRDRDARVAVVTLNQVMAPNGKPFFETKTIQIRQRVGEQAGPLKMHFSIGLPSWAPPGKYAINIQAEDQVGHKTQTASPTFTVNAPSLETSTSFVAKGIELSTSRDGPAQNPPVFTAGQTVWLRFRVLGMKSDEKGRLVLTEDWGVFGPDGKSAFEKSDDSILNESFVYPPPFYPFGEYVSLPSSVEAGDYRFHVVLHDKIAGADFTIDQPFSLKKP